MSLFSVVDFAGCSLAGFAGDADLEADDEDDDEDEEAFLLLCCPRSWSLTGLGERERLLAGEYLRLLPE